MIELCGNAYWGECSNRASLVVEDSDLLGQRLQLSSTCRHLRCYPHILHAQLLFEALSHGFGVSSCVLLYHLMRCITLGGGM